MTHRSTSVALAILLAAIVIGAGVWLLADRASAVGILANLGVFEPAKKTNPVESLYERFASGNPGRGVTDYPGNTVEDIPKSYAMILKAETIRQRHGYLEDLPSLAHEAGNWLLDNSDLDNDGIIGWGVPVAWDAYGDGSENPVHTAYTISTAIVVDALLDWMQADPLAPGARILSTVEMALAPFTGPEYRSPSGMSSYSFTPQDRPYDTFNPAAYLAGQMQRFSRLTHDASLALKLQNAADDTMLALLEHRKVNPITGSWYWTYSVQEEISNDLPHASYIIDGILVYVANSGRLADEFDIPAVTDHLREFTDRSAGFVRGWPFLQDDIDRSVRSYGLGMAMSLTCSNSELAGLGLEFSDYVELFRNDDGLYLKRPVGSELGEPLVVNEYEAYLYLGLVQCGLARQRKDAIAGSVMRLKLRVPEPASPVWASNEGELTVPFVHPEPGANVITVLPDVDRFALITEGGARLNFANGLLPLASFETDASARLVVLREIGTDALSLELRSISDDQSYWHKRLPSLEGESEPMFRAAILHDEHFYLVVYDNVSLANYLSVYEVTESQLRLRAPSLKLPLLGDPAGGTYEMIPGVTILARPDGVELFGGTLVARISSAGELIDQQRHGSCRRIIDVLDTEAGAAILCHVADQAAASDPFTVIAPEGLAPPMLESGLVPFGLSFRDGKLEVSYADSSDALRKMFENDLQRIQQNGWMEFGISNTEGRIPWSQMYYLNGLMDMLLLVETDAGMAEAFSPLSSAIRSRLDLEMLWIARHWREGRFPSRGFTVDRSPALFAVQTSRLLLLFDRYISEFAAPSTIEGVAFGDLRELVQCLRGHIDVLARGGEPAHWMARDNANLRWPKGSAFSFDGMAVPFNHQNEWAYSVYRSGPDPACPRANSAATEIVRHFMDRVAPAGRFPQDGTWDYWWGTAYDGWVESDGVSVNRPEYTGDRIKAWISFRTIDLLSSLAAIEALPGFWKENVISSALYLTRKGLVYPFASYELARRGYWISLEPNVASYYARVSSPWEIQSAVWAYQSLVRAR